MFTTCNIKSTLVLFSTVVLLFCFKIKSKYPGLSRSQCINSQRSSVGGIEGMCHGIQLHVSLMSVLHRCEKLDRKTLRKKGGEGDRTFVI